MTIAVPGDEENTIRPSKPMFKASKNQGGFPSQPSTSSSANQESSMDFSYGRCGPMDKWISILKGKLDPNQARMGSASSIISIIFCCSSIESIPAEIAEFSKLAKLDCSFNAIKQINGDLFPKLTALSTLDLKSNQIHTLPNEIRVLKSLRYLNLFKNRISTINSAIWEGLVNLKFLDLSRNEIQELPDSLFNCCQNLETLLLNHNKIRVIQDQIRNLGKLKKCNLSSNLITGIPAGLFEISSLIHLDMSSNRLEILMIPDSLLESFPWSKNLKELLLHGNDLYEIPAEISKCDQLELLDISRTKISTLPADLASLQNLEEIILDLEDSKSNIRLPPLAICVKGTKEIIEYLKDVQKGVPDAKYCVVQGDGFVMASKLDLAGSNSMLYTGERVPQSDQLPTLTATDKSTFKIFAVDKFQRPKKIGGDVFSASIQEVLVSDSSNFQDKNGERIQLEDIGDGSYLGSFSIKRVGVYEIQVKCGLEQVADSPYRIRVVPSTIYAPCCTAIGPGTDKSVVGLETRFQITAIDKYMNLITKAKAWVDSDMSINATWIQHTQLESAKFSFKHRFEYNDDGTVWVYYSTNASGVIAISVRIRGEEMNPIEVPVEPGPTYPFNCISNLSNGVNKFEIGERASFIVKAKDRFRNSRHVGGDSVIAFLISPDGVRTGCEVLDGDNGEYYCSFIPKVYGLHKIEVGIQSSIYKSIKKIIGSPFELQITDNKDDELLQHQKENQRLANNLNDVYRKLQDLQHALDKERFQNEALAQNLEAEKRQHENNVINLTKDLEAMDLKIKERESKSQYSRRRSSSEQLLSPNQIRAQSNQSLAGVNTSFQRSSSIEHQSRNKSGSDGSFKSFSVEENQLIDIKENSVLIYDPKSVKMIVDNIISQALENRQCVLPFPAHTLFMCAKWSWNESENPKHVKELLQYGIHKFRTEARSSLRERDSLDLVNLLYWLSNMLYLLGSVRSDLKSFKLATTSEINLFPNASVDPLAPAREDKRPVIFAQTGSSVGNNSMDDQMVVESKINAMKTIQDEMIVACEEMYDALVTCMRNAFPPQTILGAMSEGSSQRNSYFKTLRGQSRSLFGTFIDNMASVLLQLRCNNIEMAFQLQLFSSFFAYVNASLFNHLIHKKVGSGVIMAMRINLQNMQEWAIEQDIKECNLRLVHISQTLDLLGFLSPKFTSDHADTIAATVSSLNESQLYRLLKLYGEKVAKEVIIATVTHFRTKQMMAQGIKDIPPIDAAALKNEAHLNLDASIMKGPIALTRVIHEPIRLPRNLRVPMCRRVFIQDQ